MCGIAGLISFINPVQQTQLKQMAQTLQRRGPDDQGFFQTPQCGLVHTRLSIIDLTGGRQPIFNEDKTLVIVCNGELYNYQHWKKELEQLGHHFSTNSDSEVILHLYEQYGIDFLSKINGMFVLAILNLRNPQKPSLFMARDRFGKKPLFYTQISDQMIAFASGPTALISLPEISSELDYTAIHDYLEYQYIPEPRTIYQSIKKLPPHHFATWENGVLSIKSYWDAHLTPCETLNYKEQVQTLQKTLSTAVQQRMVADVPIGSFLSGGMDSSIITALAQSHSSTPIQTFSIGFPSLLYDEREYAATVSKHLHTDHHFLEVNPNNFSLLEELVSCYEEPFADASMLPTALLSKFTKQSVKVALSGDGADELFGGYERYQVMHFLQKFSFIPLSARQGIAHFLLSILPNKTEERSRFGRIHRLLELFKTEGLPRYLQIISRFSVEQRRAIYDPEMQNYISKSANIGYLESYVRDHNHWGNIVSELDISTYLPNDILVKVDRASMAYGLEVRSPFLDANVAQLAFQYPFSFKIQGKHRKRILKDAFSDLLPAEIFTRRKMGFGVPLAQWFRKEWANLASQILLNPNAQIIRHKIVTMHGIQMLWASHCQGQADHSYPLFAFLMLELFLQKIEK